MSFLRWAGSQLAEIGEGFQEPERARQRETERRQEQAKLRLQQEQSEDRIREADLASKRAIWQGQQVSNTTQDALDRDSERKVRTATGLQPLATQHETAKIGAGFDGRERLVKLVGDQAADNRSAILGPDPSSNFSRYMAYLEGRDQTNADLIRQQMPTQGQQMFNNLLMAGALALTALG